MAIKVTPQWDDLDIKRDKGLIKSATLRFNIIGTTLASEAENALHSEAPLIIFGSLLQVSSDIVRTARLVYEGTVNYERKELGAPGEETFQYTFDTTGGTQHITQSYQTRGRYAASGKTAPNHNGAIGVSDNDITGCDVVIPALSFTMSRTNDGILNLAVIKALAALTGKMNSAPFFSFEAGEVLFEGASGSQSSMEPGHEKYDISYKFKASPNVSSMTVGDINVGQKYGWDYFWVQYIEKEDTQSKTTKKVPLAGYVEQVYPAVDLNQLL